MNTERIKKSKKELEHIVEILDNILEGNITQKQAADRLGLTSADLSYELSNNFLRYIKNRDILSDESLSKCLKEAESPCEKIAKDIFKIEENNGIVLIETASQDLFISEMKKTLSEQEYYFMSLRYGIETGNEPMTYNDIAKVTNEPLQTVKNAITRSLNKLRQPIHCKKLLPQHVKLLEECEAKLYPNIISEYKWLLHHANLIQSMPEIKNKLEKLVMIEDIAKLPMPWKKVLEQNGIYSIFDYIEADERKFHIIQHQCPGFGRKKVDVMLGIRKLPSGQENFSVKINETELSRRIINALSRAGIKTLEDLALKSTEELEKIPGLGENSLLKIKELMEEYDIQFVSSKERK